MNPADALHKVIALQRIRDLCDDSSIDVRRRLHQIKMIARGALAAEEARDKLKDEPSEDEAPGAVWKP